MNIQIQQKTKYKNSPIGLTLFFFAGFFARMATFNTLQRTNCFVRLLLQLLCNRFASTFANKKKLLIKALHSFCLQVCLQKCKLLSMITKLRIDLFAGSGGFQLTFHIK
jgi:hypothetical protein